MRLHLLVVSEKKIKMLKSTFVTKKVKYYKWRHHNFCAQTAHNKYLHEIRAHYFQYFNSYNPHRHPQDAVHCPPLRHTISS